MKSTTLSPLHKRAYIAFFVTQLKLRRLLDKKLIDSGRVGLEVYGVLLGLEEAPNHRLRMVEIADTIGMSPSGLTRLADRLETLGLIKRTSCPSDRRSIHVEITELGLEERALAWPVMVEVIQTEFADLMSEEEAKIIGDVFLRGINNPADLPGMPSCLTALEDL